jgi:hypothetical protein
VDEGAVRRVLHAFADAGGDLFDTSSAYQLGASEERLGAFLAEAGRDRFIIASKYGRTAQAAPAPSLVGSHRKAILTDVEGSLRRLQTDRIDIYMPHFDDGRTPIEEIMAGLDDLVRTGRSFTSVCPTSRLGVSPRPPCSRNAGAGRLCRPCSLSAACWRETPIVSIFHSLRRAASASWPIPTGRRPTFASAAQSIRK